MNTATTELAIARNDQGYENAFQAAETGLEQAIAQGTFPTSGTVQFTQTIPNTNDTVTASIQCQMRTIVPDKAFSLGSGGNGVVAYHFDATADAEARRSGGGPTERDSTALHTQRFYVVGPDPGAIGPGC